MTGRARSEHIVRSSASSMMRKLSVASITSNFTKRSGNAISLQPLSRLPGEDNSDGKFAISDNAFGPPVKPNAQETATGNTQPAASNDLDLQFDSLFDQKVASWTAPPVSESGPIETMKRLTALRVKNVVQPDKNCRLVSPPTTPRKTSLIPKTMRTASRGSIGGHSASPLSEISRESENHTPVKAV